MADGRAATVLRRAWAGLLDLVYPPHCVACGRMGAWLCGPCLAAYPAYRPPWCARCGQSLPNAGLCRACRTSASTLGGVRSVGPHVGVLREAVHALKYEGVRVLAEPLAALMAGAWTLASPPMDVIVPVPLHPARVRRRGYNQAVVLARALAPRLGLPLGEGWLVRERDTRSQVGLTRAERWANVNGAFRACDAVAGRRVLLVDDVFTSGATLRAAATTLRAAGAGDVWALTLTRAQPAGDGPAAPAVHHAEFKEDG